MSAVTNHDVLVVAHHLPDFANWFFTNFDPTTGDVLAVWPGYIKVAYDMPEGTRVHHYRYISRPENLNGYRMFSTIVVTDHFHDRRMTFREALHWQEGMAILRGRSG